MEKCERKEPMKKVYLRSFAKPSERKRSPECWMLSWFQAKAISRFADEFSAWDGKYKLFPWETAHSVYRAAVKTREVIWERGQKFLADDGLSQLGHFIHHEGPPSGCMAESFSIEEVNPAAYSWYDKHKDGFKTQDPILKQWVHLAYQIHVLKGMAYGFYCNGHTCDLLTHAHAGKIADAVDRVIRCMDHKFPSYLYFSVPFDRDKTPDLFCSGYFSETPYQLGADFFRRVTEAFDRVVSERDWSDLCSPRCASRGYCWVYNHKKG